MSAVMKYIRYCEKKGLPIPGLSMIECFRFQPEEAQKHQRRLERINGRPLCACGAVEEFDHSCNRYVCPECGLGSIRRCNTGGENGPTPE